MFKSSLVFAAVVSAMAVCAAELPDFVSFSRRTGTFTIPAVEASGMIQQFGPNWEAATQGLLRPDEGFPVTTDGFEIKGVFKSGGARIPLSVAMSAKPGADGRSFRYQAQVTSSTPVESRTMALYLGLATDEGLPKLAVDGNKVVYPKTEGSTIMFDRPMTDNLSITTSAGTLFIYGNCTVFIQDSRATNRMTIRLVPRGIKSPITDWNIDLEFAFKPASTK